MDPVLNLPVSSSVTSSNHLMRLQCCEKAMGWCTAQCKMLLFCVKLCEIDIGPTKGTGLLVYSDEVAQKDYEVAQKCYEVTQLFCDKKVLQK